MLTVNELFSGIGAFRKALINLQIPHAIVGMSEIDKFAIKSYEAMYGNTYNYGDISKLKELKHADLWTYGFPCQDISIAGTKKGIIKDETRSGLLYEVERLLIQAKKDNKLPKYLIMENVKNLIGKKFKNDFLNWLNTLKEIGYNSSYKVLNSKDYGIPQNRERVFVVSIREDLPFNFNFPQPQPLQCLMRDMLEEKPLEKYYISDQSLKSYIELNNNIKKGRGFRFNPQLFSESAVAKTITTRPDRLTENYIIDNYTKCNEIGMLKDGKWDRTIQQNKRVYSTNALSPTIMTSGTGTKGTKILTRDRFEEYRIRKITPKECWRLMGFTDKDFEKVYRFNSDTQLYKQAGNSIVVQVLEAILRELLIPEINKSHTYYQNNIITWLGEVL